MPSNIYRSLLSSILARKLSFKYSGVVQVNVLGKFYFCTLIGTNTSMLTILANSEGNDSDKDELLQVQVHAIILYIEIT